MAKRRRERPPDVKIHYPGMLVDKIIIPQPPPCVKANTDKIVVKNRELS